MYIFEAHTSDVVCLVHALNSAKQLCWKSTKSWAVPTSLSINALERKIRPCQRKIRCSNDSKKKDK